MEKYIHFRVNAAKITDYIKKTLQIKVVEH